MLMPWVWCVGGGRLQEPLIREVASRGYRVFVGDANPLCHALQIPEAEVYLADTSNPEFHLHAVTAIAHDQHMEPSAVMTAGTDVGPTVARVANAFGLPGVPYDVAYRVKNKAQMRAATHLDHPWWSITQCTEYPCIEKPTMLSASRGVRMLTKSTQFKWKADTIWEELLTPHDEASTDWMVVDGYPIYVNGAHRWFADDRLGLEIGWVNPFIITPAIQSLAEIACARLGVKHGPFKMDLICDHRYGWTLLECATRWSGSFDHTVGATLSTGRNLSACLADYYLGGPFDSAYAFSHANVACHVCGYAPIVKGDYLITTEMLTTIKAGANVHDVIVLRWSGKAPTNLSERPLFIITMAGDPETAKVSAIASWQSWLEYERTMSLGGGDT